MPSDASLTPDLIQHQSFTSGFRGYDQAEVRSFLNRVASELRLVRERNEQLESAWRSAEERAARPPVLDEDTLMAAVGEETASILRSARAAAADMRNRAAKEAERLVTEARAEAGTILDQAKEHAAQETQAAEASVEGILSAARAEASEMVEKARAETTTLLDRARAEASGAVEKATAEANAIRSKAEQERQMTIEGANSTRDRILDDLSRRRRVATVQIEQLRAGRERLIESYAVVRRTLEEAQSELSRADAEARAAADEVGRRLRQEPEVQEPEVQEAAVESQPEPAGADQPEPEPAAAVQPEPDPVAAVEPEPVEPGPDPAPEPVAEEPPSEEPVAEEPVVEEPVEEAARPEAPQDVPAEAEPAEPAKARARKRVSAAAQTEPATEEAEEQGGSKVDELFAKIRATRTEPEGDQAETPVAETAEPQEVQAAEQESEEPSELSEADETLLQERESVVVDLEVTLTRRLKRALQDEQNDLLDRLRNLKGEPTVDGLLPDEEEQITRYSGTARSLLDQAAAAGAQFANRLLAASAEATTNGANGTGRSATKAAGRTTKAAGSRAKTSNRAVEELARDAGTNIVSALRRRLEHAISLSAGDDQAVLIESVGAAYREWKTQRIERLAGDTLAAAFSRGTWEAAPDGTLMRWIVEDTDGPCPDCDDDALAGELPKGEAFPTGQHHPPAHTGCRCLLVPASS